MKHETITKRDKTTPSPSQTKIKLHAKQKNNYNISPAKEHTLTSPINNTTKRLATNHEQQQ
jgi:hypothetical protein